MITAGEAIKKFCEECVGSSKREAIKNCGGEFVLATKKPCALFKYRLKDTAVAGKFDAIRKKCRKCQGGSMEAVRECTTTTCPLFPLRTGAGSWRKSGHGSVSKNRFRKNQ